MFDWNAIIILMLKMHPFNLMVGVVLRLLKPLSTKIVRVGTDPKPKNLL